MRISVAMSEKEVPRVSETKVSFDPRVTGVISRLQLESFGKFTFHFPLKRI